MQHRDGMAGQWLSRRRALAAGAAGLGGALAAACGAGGTSGQPSQGAARRGPVSIDVLTRAGVNNPTGHSQYFNTTAKQSFTPETNITVNFIDADPDVGTKLTVMAAGGTVPDASWFGIVADGSAGREQAQKGIFKPLDDLIKKDTKFDLKPYFKSMLDAFTVAGKLYALPIHAHYGTNVLYYNKPALDAAGIKIPADGNWTIDEFVAAGQKAVKRDQDIWFFWPDFADVSEFGVFWVRQFGGEFLDEAGKKVLLDSKEARDGLQWVYDCASKFGLIDNLYRSESKDALFEQQGKLLTRSTTPGLVAEYRKPGQQRVKFDLGIALFPKGPKGHGTQASGSGMGLTNPAKADAVWEWLKFVTSKENGIGQVFGGAGSPGGRTDVWTDPKLLAFDPIYSNIVKAYPQGAGSLRLPANNRRTELLKAVNDELANFWKGQASVADATAKAVQAGNAVLSQ
jgi:multiple sugar transport system substrate-binding protein